MKMNNYYFKIDTPVGERYCCFGAKGYSWAKRNALFACFYDEALDEIGRSIKALTQEEKHLLLDSHFGSRVEDATEEDFNKYDPTQYD